MLLLCLVRLLSWSSGTFVEMNIVVGLLHAHHTVEARRYLCAIASDNRSKADLTTGVYLARTMLRTAWLSLL